MNFLVILFVILKNIIYGLSVFFTGSLTENVDVLDVLALRFLLSFLALFLLKQFKILKIETGVRDFFRKEGRSRFVGPLLLAGIFEPVLYMFFETAGISMTTGITTGVILALAPVFSCICESFVLHEKSSLLQKVFLGIGIVGVIYIAVNTNTNDGHNTVSGIVFLFLAVISGQLYSVFSRKSSAHFNAFEVSYVTCMLGTVVFNLINVIRHIINGTLLHYFDPFLQPRYLLAFAYLSILSTIVATTLNNYALSKVKVSTISAFGGVSTLVTIAAGVLLNDEKLYPFHLLGLLLIVIRMVGVSYIDIKKNR